MKSILVFICSTLSVLPLYSADMNRLSLKEALDQATAQNLTLQAAAQQLQVQQTMIHTALSLPPTSVSTEFGNVNSMAFDTKFSVSQSFAFPTVYRRQKSYYEAVAQSAAISQMLSASAVALMVHASYLEVQYLHRKIDLLQQLAAGLDQYRQVAAIRFKKGESNLLEKTTLDNRMDQIHLQIDQAQQDLSKSQEQLGYAIYHKAIATDVSDTLAPVMLLDLPDSTTINNHPYVKLAAQQHRVATAQTAAEHSRLSPELNIGYVNQSFVGWIMDRQKNEVYKNMGNRFSSIQLGIGIPIISGAQKARIKAAVQNEQLTQTQYDIAREEMKWRWLQASSDYRKQLAAIQYYKESALPQARTITETADLNYKNGAISYLEWSILINNAINIQSEYIDAIKSLNECAYNLQYFTSNNF